MLLFTPFSATRFAMHRIYADRINSRGMSRVFCELRSQKTPRGILPVNSNPCFSIYIRWRERYNHKAKRINREIMKTAGERIIRQKLGEYKI